MIAAAEVMAVAHTSEDFTRFDGNLAGVEGLPDYALGAIPISPTALEKYAGCPHAFFVERLLKVSRWRVPRRSFPFSTRHRQHRARDDGPSRAGVRQRAPRLRCAVVDAAARPHA